MGQFSAKISPNTGSLLSGNQHCIGQNLRMRVVAEGVENDAQRRFLDALGCDAQQGYLYSRPLSAAEFGDWLDRQSAPATRRRA